MTSESIRIELQHPTGHRNRHVPRLCPECGYPLTSRGACTRCTAAPSRTRPVLAYPDRLERIERMAVC